MRRRAVLRAVGVGIAVPLAGCLGGQDAEPTGGDGGSTDADSATGDGQGPADDADGDEVPEAANEFGYETLTVDGVDVPLVPLEDAIDWYMDDAAVFADARHEFQYEREHIAGAVFSPAPDGQSSDDPLADLSTETRIVTYCGCPHTLSTQRGASLIRDGYVHTYALADGFQPWREAGYPVAEESV